MTEIKNSTWIEEEIISVLDILPNGKKINQGWSPKCKPNPSPDNETWGVLKTTAVQKNEFRAYENKELPLNIPAKENVEVTEGDLLLTCAGPRNRCGIACIVRTVRPRLLLSGKMYRFRANKEVLDSDFLAHYLQSSSVWDQIDNMKTGGSDSGLNLTQGRFKKLRVKLCPLPEQRAIVTKLDTLFSELNAGIAAFTQAKKQLEVYRQSILKQAFSGELTREWREGQVGLPSAEELLGEIEEARRIYFNKQYSTWEHEVQEWKEQVQKERKPAKPRKLDVPNLPNAQHEERKWNVPDGWLWTQVGTLAFVTKLAGFEYTKFVNYDESGDLKVIKAENAGPNGFKETQFSKIRSETVSLLTRSKISGGEILVVFVGAGTGNVASVPEGGHFFLGPNIGMVRPYLTVNNKFIELFFRSAVGKNILMAASKAVAQPSLSMTSIRQSPLLFPSLQEQHQIVQEIETRFSVCDQLEADIETNLKKSESLRQSLLKKAFAGELLTEGELAACRAEKDWEPAGVLLERIKKEKGEKKKKK